MWICPSTRDSIKVGVSEPGKTYVWKEQGYTSCSASCLGGVEELIINCVREDNGKVASPFLCSPETKPEARIRTCNDRPCPPRWNYSDYSACSKSCGIGIREREVGRCVLCVCVLWVSIQLFYRRCCVSISMLVSVIKICRIINSATHHDTIPDNNGKWHTSDDLIIIREGTKLL